MVAQQVGRDAGRFPNIGQRRLGVAGDFGEVRRTLDVEIAIALSGSGAYEADSALGDRLWVKSVAVARHERHAGDADDLGLAAGEREHALAAAADHYRWMRPLHRPRPSRVPAHANELARVIQFVALPMGLDKRDHLGQLGNAAPRTVEFESHRGVFDFAPAGTDTQFQPA